MNNPGCFGSVIYYDTSARRCQSCPVQSACAGLVEKNKKDLTEWYSVLSVGKKAIGPKRSESMAVSVVTGATKEPKEEKTVVVSGVASTTLNKKPREFVENWTKKGVDFDSYKTGVNPFKTCGNKFAVVAMDFFLENPLGVTKNQLTDELVKKCGSKGQGWGLGTAASHAGIVIEAFEFLGIVCKSEGKIYLR